MTKTRIRFIFDENAQFEECNGEARPLTAQEYKDNPYMRDGQVVPYEQYLQYEGNPKRHVYLGCEVQTRCACCGQWKPAVSLWNIDMMDDAIEYRCCPIGTWEFSSTAFSGYLREVAQELVTEAETGNGTIKML